MPSLAEGFQRCFDVLLLLPLHLFREAAGDAVVYLPGLLEHRAAQFRKCGQELLLVEDRFLALASRLVQVTHQPGSDTEYLRLCQIEEHLRELEAVPHGIAGRRVRADVFSVDPSTAASSTSGSSSVESRSESVRFRLRRPGTGRLSGRGEDQRPMGFEAAMNGRAQGVCQEKGKVALQVFGAEGDRDPAPPSPADRETAPASPASRSPAPSGALQTRGVLLHAGVQRGAGVFTGVDRFVQSRPIGVDGPRAPDRRAERRSAAGV